MSVINTNVLSLVTQNNLQKSQGDLSTAIQRLSSGLRINSAKDDAAGQAIANRFTSNIKGLTVAQRNANDGISLAQTTEGALTEVNNNLQRIRELAVQASNGSNSAADLKSIQAEVNQRIAEIDRVSAQTNFNGTKVLSSTAKALTIQVGASDSQTISINLSEISSKTLSLQGFNISGPVGSSASATAAAPSASTVAETAAFLPNATTTPAFAATVAEKTAGDLAKSLGVAAGSVVIAGGTFTDSKGNLFAQATITPATGAETATLNAQGNTGFATATAKVVYFALNPADANTSTSTPAFTVDTSKLAMPDLNSVVTANPLSALDTAVATVDKLRGSLGAVQNRFDSVIANLGTTITNLSSSRSRIEDADYSKEVSNMTRAQILQQAGTSVLAQANQTSQGVLSLLR